MNSPRNISKRLIDLFPVQLIKEAFNQKGNSKDVLDAVTGNNNISQINDFVYNNHSLTKQHIYLFSLDKNFNQTSINNGFPLPIIKEEIKNGELIVFCLPEVVFSVYLSNPTDKVDIVFRQPLIIRVKNKDLIIQYTKLEANMKYSFPLNREAKKNGEINSEESTLKQILAYFKLSYTVQSKDINKGVKHLWDIDDLDCYKISYRDTDSLDTSLMDANLTFKKKYPSRYDKIILTPIGEAIWTYLRKDDYLCEGFVANLNNGFINITKFPKNPNQVYNVISKILTNN